MFLLEYALNLDYYFLIKIIFGIYNEVSENIGFQLKKL